MANGAPVDFPGQVFPIPDGRDPAEFKPRADTDPPYVKPMQGAKMNDGVYRGGMKMDMSSPPMNQMTPGLMQTASTRNDAPIRVQLPDGNIGEFPGSMSHEAIEAVLQKQYPSPSRKRTPAPPGTAVISSAPDRGVGRRMLDTLRNGPFGFAMQETMPKVADALGLNPTLSQNNPEYQAAKTGQIGPVNLPQLIDANQPDTAAGFGKGMARGALRGVGMLARPDNLAMLASGPLGESKVAQTVFLSQMTEGAANQIENSVRLARQGKYAESGEQAGGAATDLYFGRKMARHEGPMPVEEVEAVKDNPTSQVATAGRPEPPSVNSSEYNRLKARIAEIQQQSKKGSQDAKTQAPVVEAKSTAPSTPAEKPNATALPPEARGESVPTAQKSEVTPTLEDVAKDWKTTAQAGPSPERKILADMALNPAEDTGAKVRQQMPAMPRGEQRKVERTPEEQATQTFFNQARQELGEKATSDQVMARVDELKYKAGYGAAEPAKPDVRDLYAQPGAKEAELTPEQKQANRDAFLGMTKKYSGENALGPGLGPRGFFARGPETSESGGLSLRPKRQPPNVKPSMLDRLRMAAYEKLNPSPDEQATMNIIRERGAEYAQKVEQISAAFDEHVKAHDSDGDAEMRTFMDAGEGKSGAQFANGKDAAVAQVLKDEFQDRWQKLSKIPGREKQGAGIENYLKHLFVGPKGQDLASQIMFGKRPLKGSASFTKHRFYEFMSDGMDMGNVPVTYNPIRMQMLGLFEIDRYLMAHSMKNDMRSSGLVKFIKNGADRPEGWQKINDEIFQPRVRQKGGFTAYGDYYAPKDAARVFNNYLSPGLRGNLAYDVVRNYGNLLNQVQLGFSAYHASFSALNSGVNDLALGLQKALGGDIPGGLHNAIRGTLVPWSAYSNYKLGKMIEQEYVTPGSNPSVARLAQALKEGGGRIGMDPMYENRAVEAFKRQWKSNPVSLKTPFHGVEAMAEKSSAYIMKYFVPRLKIGAFANLAENKMEELNARGANHDEYVTELGKLWDSVDNRMGQLTYDNLFWKKTYKDLGMVGVRSLGWNLGSFREGGGAVKDTLLQALGKQKLQMTPRQAYALALPILVGAYGTILGHLMGHPPHNTEDRFFPQTGGVDASGKPERLSLPSYMRDVYAFRHAPGETAINKAHPLVAELAELYQNHDFYNTEIRDTEAPIGQQALQVAKYLGKNFEPFGIQATQRRMQAGESLESSLGGMVGLTPAPKYIGQSKAEELSYDIAKRHMEQGPFPAGTQQQRQNLYQIRNQFHAGHLQMQDLVNLVRNGKLSVDQAAKIADEKGQPPLVRHFNTPGISWDERLKIWDAGTPEEKAELKPHLIAHIGSLQNLLPDQRMAVEKRLRDIFTKK